MTLVGTHITSQEIHLLLEALDDRMSYLEEYGERDGLFSEEDKRTRLAPYERLYETLQGDLRELLAAGQ